MRLGALTWQDGRLLLRLAEGRGITTTATLTLPAGLTRAERSDLRGNQRQPLAVTAGTVRLGLRPWEIATALLR